MMGALVTSDRRRQDTLGLNPMTDTKVSDEAPTMRRILAITATALLGLLPIGCRSSGVNRHAQWIATLTEVRAIAEIEPRSGSSVTGRVIFAEDGDDIRVTVELDNVLPGGHGMHIHEIGDCSAPDASSAGGHFNPGHAAHGGPDSDPRHLGDMGNVTADANGRVRMQFNARIGTISPGPDSFVGRSLVIHESPDDMASQPTGASGARIGCGIIEPLPGEPERYE